MFHYFFRTDFYAIKKLNFDLHQTFFIDLFA